MPGWQSGSDVVIVLSGIAPTTRGGTGRLLLGMIEEQ